jgi:hypothetical protein
MNVQQFISRLIWISFVTIVIAFTLNVVGSIRFSSLLKLKDTKKVKDTEEDTKVKDTEDTKVKDTVPWKHINDLQVTSWFFTQMPIVNIAVAIPFLVQVMIMK